MVEGVNGCTIFFFEQTCSIYGGAFISSGWVWRDFVLIFLVSFRFVCLGECCCYYSDASCRCCGDCGGGGRGWKKFAVVGTILCMWGYLSTHFCRMLITLIRWLGAKTVSFFVRFGHEARGQMVDDRVTYAFCFVYTLFFSLLHKTFFFFFRFSFVFFVRRWFFVLCVLPRFATASIDVLRCVVLCCGVWWLAQNKNRLAIRCCGDGKEYRFIIRDKQYETVGIQFEAPVRVSKQQQAETDS